MRQRTKNDALWLLATLCLLAARHVPAPMLRRLGRRLGLSAHAIVRAPRAVALANVARVFPKLAATERRAFVRECFATLGEHLGDSVALLSRHASAPLLPVSEHARAVIEEARGERRGVVFASAHLGPWERVAQALVGVGVPLVTVARQSYDPRFSRLYEELRARSGVGVVWRSTPGAAARIARTLRGGGVLGMPMDLCSRVASIDAPFLGHVGPTAVGPARIALRTGAAVVVGTVAPRAAAEPGGRLRAQPRPLPLEVTATRIRTSDLEAGTPGDRELTSRINRELSHRILDLPHSWVWMHDRWRGQTEV